MKKRYLLDILLPLIIFLAAFYIRFHNLGLVPINHDEAKWARYLLLHPEILKEFLGIPISMLASFLRESLSNRIFDSFHALSPNGFIYQVRFEAVFVGSISVVLLYILSKRLYGHKTAIISSLLLSFLPWHIIQSRIRGGATWIPFWGCLIFLSLAGAAKGQRIKTKAAWFLIGCFFLKEALTYYKAGALFIPIYFISWVSLQGNTGNRLRQKIMFLLITLAIGFLFILPFLNSLLNKQGPPCSSFYQIYHKNIFEGSLFSNLMDNFKNNFVFGLRELFFNREASSFLYGAALKGPLLLHPVLFFLVILSTGLGIFRRSPSDKIILIWLYLGLLGAMAGVSSFAARYVLIILPPLLISIGNFIAEIADKIPSIKNVRIKKAMHAVLLFCLSAIVALALIRWIQYYHTAPFDFEECRQNSFGCKEAAEHLIRLPNLKDYDLLCDARMTTDIYLGRHLLNRGQIDIYYNFNRCTGERDIICVAWALESHPKDYWEGLFSTFYEQLKRKNASLTPIKTVYYPNGIPALHIFIVKRGSI